jgi:glutamate carboxypeptidase
MAAPGWARIDDGTTVTPTLLHAGTTANTVPAHAEITLDVRAWTRDEQERVDALVRGWRPSYGAVTIHGGIDRPALEKSASDLLLATARRVAEERGLPDLQARAVGGASDGNLTAAAGVPTLDGLGAVGDGAHAEHEWVSVPAMAERAALVAGLLSKLLSSEDVRS